MHYEKNISTFMKRDHLRRVIFCYMIIYIFIYDVDRIGESYVLHHNLTSKRLYYVSTYLRQIIIIIAKKINKFPS